MSDLEEKMRVLGKGWCLKITDVPKDVSSNKDEYMWACWLARGATYGGTATEGVDWFIGQTPEKVLDIAIEMRKFINRERKREEADAA